MNDYITYSGIIQHAIDNFIDCWITGVYKIFGDDADETSQAPIPFYQSGSGYWFSYNDGVISGTAPATGGWSYGHVSWVVFTSDDDERDIHINLACAGVEDSSRPPEWNYAVVEYWNANKVPFEINDAFIINNQIDYFGIEFRSNTNSPTCIAGFRYNEQNSGYGLKTFLKDGQWLSYNGTVIDTFDKVTISDFNYDDVTMGAPRPCQGYILNLPRTQDSFWVSIGNNVGDQTLINNYNTNYYNHNTNNNYLTTNNYNEFNNSYTYNLNPDVDFHVDVGLGGLNIDIAPKGVAVGGGAVLTGNPSLNFDDLIDLLQPAVDNINNNGNLDVDIQLHDFDYYMSKYTDQGDFYITPIEQIPKLPQLPDLAETSLDIGSPLTIIGSSITSLFELYSSFGTSALLTFVFLLSVVVSRLRGD